MKEIDREEIPENWWPMMIQIMPAPADMQAVYFLDDGTFFKKPVDGIALVEDKDGFRSAEAFTHSADDGIGEVVSRSSNFLALVRAGCPDDATLAKWAQEAAAREKKSKSK